MISSIPCINRRVICFLFVVVLMVITQSLSADSLSASGYRDQRVTSGNSIGLAVGSDGTFGNNFVDRQSSFEYPFGTDQEHMTYGGLWVGGITEMGDTLVSTVVTDRITGNSYLADEYLDDDNGFLMRSTLFSSPYWSVDATSELDVFCSYTDKCYGSIGHHPLYIQVDQEINMYSFEPFDSAVMITFTITNTDTVNSIYDLYTGFYAELTSGWKEGHFEWPPSGWFGKSDIAWVDSLHLVTEHHYQLDSGDCPSWCGYCLLGTLPIAMSEKTVSFNWWDWDPAESNPETPSTDGQRYLVMKNGEIDQTDEVEAPEHDPVTLLSVGPLGTCYEAGDSGESWVLPPGESISFSMAIVGGTPAPAETPPRTAAEDIIYNSSWITQWYEMDFEEPNVEAEPCYEVPINHETDRLVLLPNPTRGMAQVKYRLPAAGEVEVSVFDVTGRLVRTLMNEIVNETEGEITFDGRNEQGDPIVQGLYFIRLISEGQTLSRPMIMIR